MPEDRTKIEIPCPPHFKAAVLKAAKSEFSTMAGYIKRLITDDLKKKSENKN